MLPIASFSLSDINLFTELISDNLRHSINGYPPHSTTVRIYPDTGFSLTIDPGYTVDLTLQDIDLDPLQPVVCKLCNRTIQNRSWWAHVRSRIHKTNEEKLRRFV